MAWTGSGWQPGMPITISPSKPKPAAVLRVPARKKMPKHSTAAQRGSLVPVKFAPSDSEDDLSLPDLNVSPNTRKISVARATFGSYELERPVNVKTNTLQPVKNKKKLQPVIDLSASEEEENLQVRSVKGPLGTRAPSQKSTSGASWNDIFTSPPVAAVTKKSKSVAPAKPTKSTAKSSTTKSQEKKHWKAESNKKKLEEAHKLKCLYPRFNWANSNRKGKFRPPTKRIFTSSPVELSQVLDQIYARAERVCSMDLEWEYDRLGAHRTALVQIGTVSTVVIFSVSQKAEDLLPSCLVDFLQDENFIKVGVNIKGDADKLHRDFPSLPTIRGLLELQKLAFTLDQEHYDAIGCRRHHISLQKLVAQYMGLYLDKGERTSAWEDKTLSEQQLDYAAGDVVAALQVYLRLVDMAMLSTEEIRGFCFDV